MSNAIINKVLHYLRDYFSMQAYVERQIDVETEIRSGVSFRGTNIFILILAIFVASLGLNTNSTAVIIGAMLISPLMGPIIGIGLAVGIQDFGLLKTALRNLLMATLISILTSTIFFLISPVGEGHSELLARTSPTIYDVLIALFGGGAGVIGLASRNKGNVIPGVAIATALMPPLCTVGYGIATGQPHYFFGAMYLYLINSIFIALATFIGVKLLRFKSVPAVDAQRARKVRRIVYGIAIVTLIPSLFMTYSMLSESRFAIDAQKFVNAECSFPATQVVSYKTFRDGHGQRTLDIMLIGAVMPQDSLTRALEARLKYYKLQGTRINIIQGDNPMAGRAVSEGTSTSELYAVVQNSYQRSQATIDSLRHCLSALTRDDTVGRTLAPELKVVFPQVSGLAVARPVTADIATGRLDTATVAIVSYRDRISVAQEKKLREYLQARLGVPALRLLTSD